MPDFPPTPQQAEIIETVGNEPETSIMVDSRAGSAKTTTIEMAAAHISPSISTLAVAFNKRIAEELAARLPPHVVCKTMNALGHQAWYGAIRRRLTLNADKMFQITKAVTESDATFASLDRDEQQELFSSILALSRAAKSVGLVPVGAPMMRTGLVPDDDESWEIMAFDKGIDLDRDGLIIYFARHAVLRSIRMAYESEIDFDDQIYMSVLFGGVFPRFHTVIVDEAQDLSPMNHMMLRKCCSTRLIAVGDPYQAIYAFRGADSNSMTTLMNHWQFRRLGLTNSFRVPHNVSRRQRDHVPDFASHETVNQGIVVHWPADIKGQQSEAARAGDAPQVWSISDVPREGAILCRNNAPLLALAFTFIKNRRPVKVLGNDIGAGLARLLIKVAKRNERLPLEEVRPLIDAWFAEELEKLKDKESRQDVLRDRRDSLLVLVEASGCATVGEASRFIKDLFADQKNTGLVLSSGHKAKGLEWHWVMHLDPWRIPSKQAKRQMDLGNPAPMMQEKNLRYVIETRTKGTLVLANLDDCEERGE